MCTYIYEDGFYETGAGLKINTHSDFYSERNVLYIIVLRRTL